MLLQPPQQSRWSRTKDFTHLEQAITNAVARKIANMQRQQQQQQRRQQQSASHEQQYARAGAAAPNLHGMLVAELQHFIRQVSCLNMCPIMPCYVHALFMSCFYCWL